MKDPGYPPANTYIWLNERGDILGSETRPQFVVSWDTVKIEKIKCQASSDLTESKESEWATIESVGKKACTVPILVT